MKVGDKAEVAKEVGPTGGPRTKEEVLMTKPERFAHGGEGGIAKSAASALSF